MDARRLIARSVIPVEPLPGSLVVKWVLAGIAQAVVLGVVVHKVYKPAPIAVGK